MDEEKTLIAGTSYLDREQDSMEEPAVLPITKGRHKSKVAIYIASAVLAIVLVAEVGLRIRGLGNPVLFTADSACGYLPTPSQEVRRFGALNIINRFGMRSPDFTEQGNGNAARVLFVGDSVTYGTTMVDQSEIFTSLISRDLPGQIGRPVEVLNASAGGWAVGNELGFLRSRGTFGSSLVIFVLNTGDLFQPFSRVELSLSRGFPHTPPPCALYELWVRYAWPRIVHDKSAVDPGSLLAPGEIAAGVQATLRALAQADQLTRSRGAHFAIIYSPFSGAQSTDAGYTKAFDDLRSWALTRRVPFVSLESDYAKLPATLVYRDGIHLRPAGHKLVASAVEREWARLNGGPPLAEAQ